MRIFISVAAFAALFSPTHALAWGKTGHRVIGKIAEPFLTAPARAGVKTILGAETMAEASNWPDFMRADPAPFCQQRWPRLSEQARDLDKWIAAG